MNISSPYSPSYSSLKIKSIKSPLFRSKLDLIKKQTLKPKNFDINLLLKTRNKIPNLIIMKSLWNDLGVNPEYQKLFEIYMNDTKDEQEKIEMVNYEKNYLKKFREVLVKLSEEISNRDELISKLKKYCNQLDKYTYDKNIYPNKININENEMLSNLFNKIYNIIILYRISTVNIINRIMRVREISSYYELNNKWDASNIHRSYMFKKNYLLSMYNDIEFINKSSLIDYIKLNNENINDSSKVDLFFSNWKYLNANNDKKLNLSISIELQREIIKCKYIIMQDNFLYKIKKEKRKLIKINKNIFTPKSRPSHSVGNSYSRLSKKSRSEIHLMNQDTENKFFEIFGHNQINLSRTLYYLKKTMGDKYEKMFFSGNKEDLNNIQRNLHIMNNFFALNNNYDICNNENDDNLNILVNSSKNDISEKSEIKKMENLNDLFTNESDNNINNRSNNFNYSNNNSQINNESKIKKKLSEIFMKKSEEIKINNKDDLNEKNKNRNIKSKNKLKKGKTEDKTKEEKTLDKINKELKIINNENIFIERKKIEEIKNIIKVENISINPVKKIKKFSEEKIKSDFVIDINIIKDNTKEKEKENEKEDENNISEQNKKSEILNDEFQIINNSEIEIQNKENNNNINDISDITKENNETLNSKKSGDMEKEKEEEKEKEIKEIKEIEENQSKNYISISVNDSIEDNTKPQNKLFQYRQFTSEEISKYNMEYDKFS